MNMFGIKKFPFFRQYDTMDCGPTCIKMIAKHYGRSYSLQHLREKSNIGRVGVTLLSISNTAQSVGFSTFGSLLTFEQLEEVLLPCIAHWKQDHFVIVYKIKNNIVYIADPNTGLVKYSKEDFLLHWLPPYIEEDSASGKGAVLLLEPTEEFYNLKDDEEKGIGLSMFLTYFGKNKSTLFQISIGLIFSSLVQLLMPFLTQAIVDIGINKKDINFLYLVLLAQMLLIIGQLGTNIIRGWLLLYFSSKINLSILTDFIVKLMRLPISFFDIKLVGDLFERINDHKRIEVFLTGHTLNILFSITGMFIFGIALFKFNSIIFFIYFIFSTLYILWVLLFLKRRQSVEGKSFETSAKVQGNIFQILNGIQDIRLNNAEPQKIWEWESLQINSFKVNIEKLKIEQFQEFGSFIFNQTKNILITFLTAKLVIDNQLTLGQMMACQYIIGQLNSPLEQLVYFVIIAQDAKLSLDRLNEIHEITNEETIDKKYQYTIESRQSDITFENVSFSYPGLNTEVLKKINIVIPCGKVTAIVGASGSGKTTILKLLLKIYSAKAGKIKIGNQNFEDISHTSWRKQCGIVMQDGYIFSDSISNNIALSSTIDQKDYDRIMQAVDLANIKDYVNSLPLKLETKIGSEGLGLSQGQKQRLLIARAVYKEPNYIFLDEATNALDANNEKLIINALDNFYKGRTVVVIAHRLSTIKNADQIIVLDKGVVVESGNHNTLINKKGYYFNLVRNQLGVEVEI